MCAPGKKGEEDEKRGSSWSLYFFKAGERGDFDLEPGCWKRGKKINKTLWKLFFLASRLIQNKNRLKRSAQKCYFPSSLALGSATVSIPSIHHPFPTKCALFIQPLSSFFPFRYQSPMSNRRPPLPPLSFSFSFSLPGYLALSITMAGRGSWKDFLVVIVAEAHLCRGCQGGLCSPNLTQDQPQTHGVDPILSFSSWDIRGRWWKRKNGEKRRRERCRLRD